MTVLWINLVIVMFFALSARYFSTITINNQVLAVKPNKLLTFFVLLALVMVSGLRANIGDTYFYMYAYKTNNINWDYIMVNKDIGFGILQMLLQKISKNPQILVFTTAFFTMVLIIPVFYKYSRLFELSFYVFLTGGMFVTSMNGIRQFLASAIIFAATPYLLNGKWKKYMAVVLFASVFHQSALMLIPIYFMVRSRAWSKTTFLLLSLSVVLVLGFNQFSEILFSALKDTQYGEYQNFQEGGANFIRVVVTAVPIIIAYIGRNKLKELFPKSDPIVNMAVLGLVFMIIATQNWIFARFYFYFGLYQIILISWIIKLFRKKEQMIIYMAIIACYFIYFYYENVITLGLYYRSDYFG